MTFAKPRPSALSPPAKLEDLWCLARFAKELSNFSIVGDDTLLAADRAFDDEACVSIGAGGNLTSCGGIDDSGIGRIASLTLEASMAVYTQW